MVKILTKILIRAYRIMDYLLNNGTCINELANFSKQKMYPVIFSF
jgi:hypothetical protein